jgi:uncharacterized membrane protein
MQKSGDPPRAAHRAANDLRASAATESMPLPVREIGPADLRAALAAGIADFRAMPSHLVLLCIIYPIAGLFLARLTASYDIFPLLFPLMAGFALVGPFAALGLYEISRRRERGENPSWQDAFAVLRSPSIGGIVSLGVLLLGIFMAWLWTALLLYRLTFGDAPVTSLSGFLAEVLTTPHGWALIVLGNGIGFLFALVAFAVSVVSFPLLLDREADAMTAVRTSIAAVRQNPRTMALWGLIVAGLLVLGTLPVFVGLVLVIPVLGHATWHLYRRVVPR